MIIPLVTGIDTPDNYSGLWSLLSKMKVTNIDGETLKRIYD